MKQTFLCLVLFALSGQAARGQFEMVKKFERPGVNARSYVFTDLVFIRLDQANRFDANDDGTADLVFIRPDSTYPYGTMHIVVDPEDPDDGTIVLALQGNQGLGFRDEATPFLGFLDIWPGTGKQDGVRSFAFGREGLYLYDEGFTNVGRLAQAFTLSRETYRLISIRDFDGDDLVDFLLLNLATRTIEVWGSSPSGSISP